MARSMTGFAARTFFYATDHQDSVDINIIVKSLNSKFFEAQCKLPLSLASVETEIIKQLKNRLIRGYVQCIIQMPESTSMQASIKPSLNTVQNYLSAIATIQTETNIQGNIDIKDLLQLPNIFIIESKEAHEELTSFIIQSVQQTASLVITEQEKEGKALIEDIHNRIQKIQNEVKVIEQLSHDLMQEKKNQVNKELQSLDADENKLMDIAKATTYLILDKIDIHEELIRIHSHLTNLTTILSNTETIEIGKRIDFTLQELTREINTITAKCSSAAISTHAINVKVELEKAREQTQNIL